MPAPLLAAAALVAAPAAPAATVLVCAAGTCAADAALARQQGLADDLVEVDLLLELDAVGPDPEVPAQRFTRSLDAGRVAAAAGRWGAAGDAAAEALDALEQHPGTLDPTLLFAAHALRAGALREAGDPGWMREIRTAAAILDQTPPSTMPPDGRLREAWLDARRELEAAGRGVLVLPALPDGAQWWVDGRPAAAGEAALLAGEHRVTAAPPGAARTWVATVVILPARTTVLHPPDPATLQTAHSAAWMLGRLEAAFETYALPEAVADRLADWCARAGQERVRLLRVVDGQAAVAPRSHLGPPPMNRPAAAEGPTRAYGETIDSTWEGHLADQHAGRQQGVAWRDPQVQVVVFDARTRRVAAEVRPLATPPAAQPRLAAHLAVGWARLLDQPHAALELGLTWGTGWLRAEGRGGLLRAPTAYNLRPGWQDRQVYRVWAGARATPWPEAGWGPYASVGPELVVPVHAGARALAGLEWRAVAPLRVAVEGAAGAGTTGSTLGLALIVGGAW